MFLRTGIFSKKVTGVLTVSGVKAEDGPNPWLHRGIKRKHHRKRSSGGGAAFFKGGTKKGVPYQDAGQ